MNRWLSGFIGCFRNLSVSQYNTKKMLFFFLVLNVFYSNVVLADVEVNPDNYKNNEWFLADVYFSTDGYDLAQVESECSEYIGSSLGPHFIPSSLSQEIQDQIYDYYADHTFIYYTVTYHAAAHPVLGVVASFNCHVYLGATADEDPCTEGSSWDSSAHLCVSNSDEEDLEDDVEAPSNDGADENNTCHPINIATGNKFFRQYFYTGQGSDPLTFDLFYNSRAENQHWSSDYRQSLLVEGETVKAKRPDGKALSFSIINNVITAESQRVERLALNVDVYELRLVDNTVERYNTNGRLLSITYPAGIVHTLSYSNNDNTITVTRNNESLQLDLVDGNLTRVVLPNNDEIHYAWDTTDRLTQVIYTDNSIRIYAYENSGFPDYITGILNENNHRISSVAYDDQGRAISSKVGGLASSIKRTQITYHEDGTRTVTNSLGKKNKYHFTQFNGEYKMTQVEGLPSQNCVSANQTYTYDANGFMASKTDWKGNVTTYVHNARGLETSRTEASGTPQARTVTTEWHPTFNLRTKIIEPERETVLTYDDSGRLTAQEATSL
jgi:YD repeat-containing protein